MDTSKLENTLCSMIATDFDEILDMRDKPAFDESWCQIFEVVAEVEVQFNREALFKKISNVTEHHEITSYIVDDFELLAKAKRLGLNAGFTDYMRECYEKGNVPHIWKKEK